MSLIICSKCKQVFSDVASDCPFCSTPVRGNEDLPLNSLPQDKEQILANPLRGSNDFEAQMTDTIENLGTFAAVFLHKRITGSSLAESTEFVDSLIAQKGITPNQSSPSPSTEKTSPAFVVVGTIIVVIISLWIGGRAIGVNIFSLIF